MSVQTRSCSNSRTITSWWGITWALTALALSCVVDLVEPQAHAADRANTTKSGGLGVREVDGTLQFEPGLKGEMRPGFVSKQGAEPWDHGDRHYTPAAGFGANRKRVPPKAPFGEMTAEEVAALPDVQEIMKIAAQGPEAIAKLVPPQRGVDIECPVCQKSQPPRGEGKRRLTKRENHTIKRTLQALKRKRRRDWTEEDKALYDKILKIKKEYVYIPGGSVATKGFDLHPDPIGFQFKCKACQTVFPHREYPQTHEEVYYAFLGRQFRVPHWVNPGDPNDKRSFSAQLWKLKADQFTRYFKTLANAYHHTGDEEYMKVFVALALELARVHDGYLQAHSNAYLPVTSVANETLSALHSAGRGFGCGMESLYDQTYESKAWDELVPVPGGKAKARHVIEDKILSAYCRRFHQCNEHVWWDGGNLGSTAAAFANMAKVTGDVRYAHIAFEGFHARFQEYYANGYDYYSMDGGNYSEMQANSYGAGRRTLEGWEDPEGYVFKNPRYEYTHNTHIRLEDLYLVNIPAMVDYFRGHLPDRVMYYNAARTFAQSGPHDPRPLYVNATLVRRKGAWSRPSTRVRNELFGYAGIAGLAEGYEGQGTPESLEGQRAYACPSSHIWGNHFQLKRLVFSMAANGRHVFPYETGLAGQNTHLNGSIPYASKDEVGVGDHNPAALTSTLAYGSEWPGLALVTMDASTSFRECGKVRRTLVHNTIDKKHPYVLDIMEIVAADEGNLRHGALLQGVPRKVAFGPNIKLQPNPGNAFIKSKKDSEAVLKARDQGLALSGHSHAAKMPDLQDFHSAPVTDSFWMDWTFEDSLGDGARTHVVMDPAEKSPHPYEAILGYGLKGQEIKATRPVFVLEQRFREKGKHRTVLVFVHEPFLEGRLEKKIESVTRAFLNAGKAIGMTVTGNGRQDRYVLSFDGEQRMSHQGLETDGYFAASAAAGGKSDLWLYRGRYATNGSRQVTQPVGTQEGEVLGVLRAGDTMGRELDSLLVTIPLAEGDALHGHQIYVYFTQDDGALFHVHPYRIQEARREGDHYRVTIDQATTAGFRMDKDGRVTAAMGAGTQVTNALKAVMHYHATTVPKVVCSGLRKPFYGSQAWVNDFEARVAETYPVPVYSTVRDAPIHCTLDGTKPSAQSQRLKGTLRVTGRQTVKAVALNPRGILSSPVFTQEFLGVLPAQFPGGPLKQGLVYKQEVRAGKSEITTAHGVASATALKGGDLTKAAAATQFDGYIKVPDDGYYVFSVQHSGHIFIDGVHISDTDRLAWGPYDAEVALRAGYHRFRVVHINQNGDLCIYWKGPKFSWRYVGDSDVCYNDALKDTVTEPLAKPSAFYYRQPQE